MAREIQVDIGDVIRVPRGYGRDDVRLEIVEADNATHTEGIALMHIAPTCIACNKPERGVDYESEFGNLCGRCITAAMEGYALQCVLTHLMQNDDEIVEVMHVMERADAHARTQTMPHVDFHSATMDMMWSWSDDDWHEIIMSWHASIRAVVEARTLIDRP